MVLGEDCQLLFRLGLHSLQDILGVLGKEIYGSGALRRPYYPAYLVLRDVSIDKLD